MLGRGCRVGHREPQVSGLGAEHNAAVGRFVRTPTHDKTVRRGGLQVRSACQLCRGSAVREATASNRCDEAAQKIPAPDWPGKRPAQCSASLQRRHTRSRNYTPRTRSHKHAIPTHFQVSFDAGTCVNARRTVPGRGEATVRLSRQFSLSITRYGAHTSTGSAIRERKLL